MVLMCTCINVFLDYYILEFLFVCEIPFEITLELEIMLLCMELSQDFHVYDDLVGCRSTRETTPCSLINSETISTPGSTTRPSHSSHRRVQAPVRTISISKELNEFFGAAERRQQQAFIDKYNFDPVNDCPLPGRYEWVKLD